MNPKMPFILISISCLFGLNLTAQPSKFSQLDVLDYQVKLEPIFDKNKIEGSIEIHFRMPPQSDKVVFDSGKLTVTKLEGKHAQSFNQKGGKTIIALSPNATNTYEVKLFYHGSPTKGLVFFDNAQKLHTVYFTSDWMICNASPDDKATFQLDLLIPKEVISIASGTLRASVDANDKCHYIWHQDYETPTYTYGFAVGSFTKAENHQNSIHFNYYSDKHTEEELQQIFQYTEDMMDFFEEKTGIKYPQTTYSQVLIGNHYQEMSGFAILRETYGNLVLNDSTETNLISHELAHQWWGNRVTCKDWNHFWLNEGFATFMSAAYNEYRFGKEKYQADIDSYFNVYTKIKSKGGDKSLVFDDWANPTGDDRNLVYFKGAYVLHLLREELGDKAFWESIKHYTKTYYGQSVTTKDFQLAMENCSGQSLETFFNKWIY